MSGFGKIINYHTISGIIIHWGGVKHIHWYNLNPCIKIDETKRSYYP